jgi:small subunit ribosomal protein S17
MAKKLVGVVSSDVRDKTITVTVTRRETHPIYGKQYTVSRKFTAHDEDNKAHKGDKVEIMEIRPVSKTKSWGLSRVVVAGHGDIELAEVSETVMEKTAPVESAAKEETK